MARALRGRGLDVTVSSELSPEIREYERLVTTVVNAYLRPACAPYLDALASIADVVEVLTSAGGLVPVADAAARPAAPAAVGTGGRGARRRGGGRRRRVSRTR